jgi:hypothetical protein
MGDNSYGIR